jgi:small multidrug resistance pump
MNLGWLFVLGGIICNASASITIKLATNRADSSASNKLIAAILSPMGIGGVFLYGMALLFYIKALDKLPLSIAHPLMTACPLAIVSCYAVTQLGESFNAYKAFGFAAIITGVVLLAISSKNGTPDHSISKPSSGQQIIESVKT